MTKKEFDNLKFGDKIFLQKNGSTEEYTFIKKLGSKTVSLKYRTIGIVHSTENILNKFYVSEVQHKIQFIKERIETLLKYKYHHQKKIEFHQNEIITINKAINDFKNEHYKFIEENVEYFI